MERLHRMGGVWDQNIVVLKSCSSSTSSTETFSSVISLSRSQHSNGQILEGFRQELTTHCDCDSTESQEEQVCPKLIASSGRFLSPRAVSPAQRNARNPLDIGWFIMI